MTGSTRPICAHCGATLPKGAGECQERPDLRLARRVLVSWDEDGAHLTASYPEQCLVLSERAVDDEGPEHPDRVH